MAACEGYSIWLYVPLLNCIKASENLASHFKYIGNNKTISLVMIYLEFHSQNFGYSASSGQYGRGLIRFDWQKLNNPPPADSDSNVDKSWLVHGRM